MREIKFRCWNKKEKQMYFSNFNGTRVHLGLVYSEDLSEWMELVPGDENQVIMQFTGLKDKNGKEIWESDLILTDDMYHDYEDGVAINAVPDGKIYRVEYRDGAFFAKDELLGEVASGWEVIGNVYENSELLKQPT